VTTPPNWEARVGFLNSRLAILEYAAHRAGLAEAAAALGRARWATEAVGTVTPGQAVLDLERLVEPAVGAMVGSPVEWSMFVLDAMTQAMETLAELRAVIPSPSA